MLNNDKSETLSIFNKFNIVFIYSGDYSYSKIPKEYEKGLKDFNFIFEGTSEDWSFDKESKMFIHKETFTGLDVSDFEELPTNILFSNTTINEHEYTDILDLSRYANSNIVVNANDNDNTISLGGMHNDVVLNLNNGINTVNINDTRQNIFNLYGGYGLDRINLKGNVEDYKWQKNADSTLTMTNKDSKSKINFDSVIDEVNLADNTNITYNGSLLNITTIDTSTPQTININGNQNNIMLYMQSGNDTLYIDGSYNTVSVWIDTDHNNLYIYSGDYNDVIIDGLDGVNILHLQGLDSDWTLTENNTNKCYVNNATGTKVTINMIIQEILFFDVG